MAKVQVRVDPDGTVRQRRSAATWEQIEARTDWRRVDTTTEAEIASQAAEDDAEAARDAAAWVRRVRRRAGLSQLEFARRIGVPIATVRDWERGRRSPEGPSRALLRVMDRIPEAALALR